MIELVAGVCTRLKHFRYVPRYMKATCVCCGLSSDDELYADDGVAFAIARMHEL